MHGCADLAKFLTDGKSFATKRKKFSLSSKTLRSTKQKKDERSKPKGAIFMKSIVCRFPYSVRVPMFVLTVLMVFLINRFTIIAKSLFVLLIVGVTIFYFWVSIATNSPFFFIH